MDTFSISFQCVTEYIFVLLKLKVLSKQGLSQEVILQSQLKNLKVNPLHSLNSHYVIFQIFLCFFKG
jgi:hypothetical protein